MTSIIKKNPALSRYTTELSQAASRQKTPEGDQVARGNQFLGFVGFLILASGLVAGESAADWEVYVSGGLGISGSVVDTDGTVPGTPVLTLSRGDGDASPLLDGAVGLRIPMDELVPREYLAEVRLPNWPMRFEFEAAGLREYEIETRQGARQYYSNITATTVMWNTWLDIPLVEIARPVQYVFGLGRQPRVRQWLDPASFYLGAGIGLGILEFEGTDNVVNGSDEIFDFAWNVGAGVNYSLTDAVDLSVGYRYVGIGPQDIDLRNGAVPVNGASVEYDTQIHELRFQVRVAVYDFLNPWR